MQPYAPLAHSQSAADDLAPTVLTPATVSPLTLTNTHPQGAQVYSHHGTLVVHPSLPDRDVTAATIEDAYVRFIFYCNPALPLSADTGSLREAFRNPPRSGGKLFSPFAIFELVKKLYGKEIKTWTELTTRLGVEPPDPGKEESTQKIAQYGVRLKKWMNSMHIKAFFEYLMHIPNEYWIKIPSDPNPVALPFRDGIAVEDDMSLRALLPHIRPKRGRKRPDDEPTESSAQRQRPLSPAVMNDSSCSWSLHSDAQALLRPVDQPRQGGLGWELSDPVSTMTNRWPNSNANPNTRSSFWDDALDSRTSTVASRSKISSQRRGAKNVSSAWKPSGMDPRSAKTRGRPPMSRMAEDIADPPLAWSLAADGNLGEASDAMAMTQAASQLPSPADTLATGHIGPAQGQPDTAPPPASWQASMEREQRLNTSQYLSERSGSRAQMTTPSPGTTMSGYIGGEEDGQGRCQTSASAPLSYNLHGAPQTGDSEANQGTPASSSMENTNPSPTMAEAQGAAGGVEDNVETGNSAATSPKAVSQAPPQVPYVREVPWWHFEKMENRTNIDALISYFTHVVYNADWVDAEGNRQKSAEIDECNAMSNATIEHMYKSAESSQAFLINLAALAGGKMLMTAQPTCYREELTRGVYTYNLSWQYRFGSIKGQFTMKHSVPIRMWKREAAAAAEESKAEGTEEPLTMEQWQAKCRVLMEELEKRDQQIVDMRAQLFERLR